MGLLEILEEKQSNIEKLLKELLERLPASTSSTYTPIEIIDVKTLSSRLGISEPTIIKWRNKKKVPFIQMGGSIRYDWHQVCKALENKKSKAQ
jgi:predicted DNA-binding transcriptional regulator AlpA